MLVELAIASCVILSVHAVATHGSRAKAPVSHNFPTTQPPSRALIATLAFASNANYRTPTSTKPWRSCRWATIALPHGRNPQSRDTSMASIYGFNSFNNGPAVRILE
jgi:hypothetical protein